MIKIIRDDKDWNAQLALFKDKDFYHTYYYHYLSKKEGETPVLISYTQEEVVIAIPLLIRNIKNSDYKDAVSVYGYSGVLSSNIHEAFDVENFHKEIHEFFYQNKIVSIFSRLHPFLKDEERILKGLGNIITLGKVVYLDLTQTLENQRANFNRRLKTYLNKSRKLCTVVDTNTEDQIKEFIRLYQETMERVNAVDYFFFEDTYFHKLLSSKDFDASLKLCVHNETQTILGGAIFIKKGNIVQYHLSGRNAQNSDVDPIKLVIDAMRIEATEQGYTHFNLGGGRGSHEDSLFRFKSGFSKEFKEFKIWKYIVNECVYSELVEHHFEDYSDLNLENVSFFPAYRAMSSEPK